MGLEAGLDNEPEPNEGPDLDEIIPEIEMDYLPSSKLISLSTSPINMVRATREIIGGAYEYLVQIKGFYEAWIHRSDDIIKNIYH